MLKQPMAPQGEARPFRAGQSHLEWDDAGAHIAVEVMDESGKLDLNGSTPEMLERLFQNLGMDYNSAHALAAAIEDWRDPDDDTRPSGAESLYYLSLPQPYRPANRDFESVDELLLVRGVTQQLLYGGYRVRPEDGAVERQLGLADCLTVSTHGASVNINYAPMPVLMTVPGMSPNVANMIVEGRRNKPYESVSDFVHDYPVLLSGDTMAHLSGGSVGPYTLVASATAADGVTARIRAIVQVSGLDVTSPAGQRLAGPPFLIHEWDDSYVR
jgi:general secretion pathway protein K